MIAGVILAAGAARRMGRCKQLLPLGGRTMLWQTVSKVCRSGLRPVVLVTGACHDQVERAVADLPLTVVYNPDWQQGQSTSLKAGLLALPPAVRAVMFFLADQPLVPPELIDRLAGMHCVGGSIIAPVYQGRRGNPVLFDLAAWRDELLRLDGDEGARRILAAHPESIVTLPVETETAGFDADTEADYRMLCELFEQTRHT